MKYALAVDLGASSGRCTVGWYDGAQIRTCEVYRFVNSAVKKDCGIVWDIDGLFHETVNGIAAAFEQFPEISEIAIDSWGVDYVLINGDTTIYPCYAYRDSRTEGVLEYVHEKIPRAELYNMTGIWPLTFNTIYQLCADKLSGRLSEATDFLMIPEYIAYRLTGVKKKEYTNATTTGLVSAGESRFSAEIIERLGLPCELFGKLYFPGETVGRLLPEIRECVMGDATVRLTASHDTASAFESVETQADTVIISSGTWSLLGIKSDRPIITERGLEFGFSNEGGVGYVRFLKNIAGLWIINRLRAEFSKTYAEAQALARLGKCTDSFTVNDSEFTAPESMSMAIKGWYGDRGLMVPESECDLFCAAYHSLANAYRLAIDELRDVSGKGFDKVCIIGGGAGDTLLCELTGQYTQMKVIARQGEATSVGNLRLLLKGELT